MRRILLPGLLLSLAFWFGAANAAEQDIMALRGNSGDGRPQVNAFQAPWLAEETLLDSGDTEAWAGRSAAGFADASYLQWKNSCVPVQPMVVGQLLELDVAASFRQVAPYVDKPGLVGDSFLNLLVEELSSEGMP